jgi:transposase
MMRRLARVREQVIARRDQQYYEFAHWLCRHAERIVLEASITPDQEKSKQMDLSELAEEKTYGGNQRHIVAPYRLRQILTQVAFRYGVEVVLVDCQMTSRTCPDCGETAPKAAGRMRTCPNGHAFDPAVAAPMELLTRWREQQREAEQPSVSE